ncbi:MAG: recombinase family protein [Pirellulales bacterium]
MPERAGLLDLARTYLENQARLWPELVGTPAVPAADAATIAAMAADFERRFRAQAIEVFRPGRMPRPWSALGAAYLRFSDENSNPRSLDQQLLNVLNRARRDGVFIPWQYVLADAAVSGALDCRRGYTMAKELLERRDETGVACFLIDDISRMSRRTIESLQLGELARATGVRVVGASDGFDSANPQSVLLLPVISSMNEAFLTQLTSKVNRGMDDAFRRGDNIQPPGVGYRMVVVTNADGSPVITHKGTIEKRAEIDSEAAAWIVRGAELIAHGGKSPGEVARLFNEHEVGGRRKWSDNSIRKIYARERLVGREVFRTTRQERNRKTGKVRYVKLPQDEWLVREAPHLRILSDELAAAVRTKLKLGAQSFGRSAGDRRQKAHRADLYPKVLVRPICGGCGKPMILGRSCDKYQSFFCFNALHGIEGCTNRGYKSARIIDEAVLGKVMATLFTADFITDLTAEVNTRLAELARQPIPSTKKLEQEIAAADRQLKRLMDRLDKADGTLLDAVIVKAEEMGRELAAKRERLKELQRAARRPGVRSVREQDVVAALGGLRDLLQGDVAAAAQVLKALVGDVVIKAQKVEGKKRPEMEARFTINAIPALAALDRGKAANGVDPTVGMWEFLNADRWIMLGKVPSGRQVVVVSLHPTPKYVVMMPQITAMADAGSGIDLISRVLGTSAVVVRDALHLRRTGQHPPRRIDPRRGRKRKPGEPPAPKYQQIAAEVDQRRKAGEGFDRLAREMKVSRGTVVRAYDYANRAEAAAAARDGRKPVRPSYRRSEESRVAKRRPRS